MNGFQAVSLLATMLGLIATVLNLVAFVREKDKSHTRAGVRLLLLLVVIVGVLLLPSYAPETARRLVEKMPPSMAGPLQTWLRTAGASSSASREGDASGMVGSFTIEIQRNFLGGIGALVSNFQFSNPSAGDVRVTAYHVRITVKAGEAPHSYDRVMADPVTVAAGGTSKAQVELDAEIRDQWVAREDLESAQRGPVEISWDCQAADGRQFQLTSSNG